MLLKGTYEDAVVFARGNIWLPDGNHRAAFEAALGQEDYRAIELELRSVRRVHVYRESDIPNRHG